MLACAGEMMFPFPVSGQVVSAERVLHAQPQFCADQGLLLALVVDAPVGHDSDVVRIPQHVMYAVDRQRAGPVVVPGLQGGLTLCGRRFC